MSGPLKKENSCSKLEPTSPTASVSESNNIAASTEFEQSISSSLNLHFEGLKFEVDPDEVQSPTSALWESLFGDQVDDIMMSSPRRNTDFMVTSPKRNPFGNVVSSYLHSNYSQVTQGPSPLGSSPSRQIEKGKEGFHDDYQRDGIGGYSTMSMTSVVGCTPESFDLPTTLASLLDYSYLPNSSRVCGSASEVVVQEGYQRNAHQMSPFPTQEQQHEWPQQLDQSLLGALSGEQGQDSGLQLVHLLLACAETVAKEDYMSARRYLQQLNRVASPLGDSMQRVASCFTDALGARLAATLTTANPKPYTPFPNSLELLKVYQILYQACPYIKFAHFTSNQAIFEAFEEEDRVHVIDLNILEGYQWPAFMQALASRSNGPPFLRITGVGFPPEAVRETGQGLTDLAQSFHIPFEFHSVGEQLEDLKPHMFNRRVGEALAVNSVNRLHRVPATYMGSLLGMIRDQAPSIVTLVEQEASHNGPYFLGRFLEALHYYSAIFDSLDSTFPPESAERAKVEQYIYAPEIRNIVACEGAERVERHERLEQWRKLMEEVGFKGVALSSNAVTQSKILLGLYPCQEYRLTEDNGCLLLGWQNRVLMAASAWRC